ncbi:MAG: polyamine aminopropyltransferase, partial [Halobacteriovoraceae bacterium]|jgi:spermidine synthase|nr:polyamine aminopropyltransferase [Halobacteriovoraceae bacterium]
MNSELWIEEKLEDFLGLRIRVDKTLFSGQSEFQSVDVVETRGHGKMLLNDGLVMVTERDEYSYHDMIAHVPLFTHPHPKNVLVIGGGDGGTAREVIRHPSVEKCTMVEIDEMVVNACKEFIPQTSSKLTDPKIDLIIGDGVKFVEDAAKKGIQYDVILVDSTDPIGPAQPLFGSEFYENILKCLSDDGLVVSQGESPFYHSEMQTKLIEIISGIFPVVSLYNFSNMTYPGGLWSFTFASKKYHPVKDFDPTRVEKSNLEFEYYNEAVHRGAFALPNFQLKRVEQYLKG